MNRFSQIWFCKVDQSTISWLVYKFISSINLFILLQFPKSLLSFSILSKSNESHRLCISNGYHSNSLCYWYHLFDGCFPLENVCHSQPRFYPYSNQLDLEIWKCVLQSYFKLAHEHYSTHQVNLTGLSSKRSWYWLVFFSECLSVSE